MILPGQRKNIGPSDLEIPSWMFVGHVERLSIMLVNAAPEPRKRRSIFFVWMKKPKTKRNQEKIAPALNPSVLVTVHHISQYFRTIRNKLSLMSFNT
ncbi:hypothetical protein KY290_001162 [Solanum tuberosum]|uniref:Uncharacterized protein n=1 Tax=Solanum tuberosum TaxID=4113 RepID=A0ABQ7WLH8_SOLTU|nr:hypothetical protein KY290_001162 [Solanum tuberosum]